MTRRIRVIINQAARKGGGSSIASHLVREFAAYDVDIRLPETYEETVGACQTAPADGVTDLVVVGGDGTVNVAINAIAGSDVRLGIIPSGTANDLATYLGLPTRLRKACAVVRRAGTRRLDLVSVNGKFYATAGGLGVVSRVATDVNAFKRTSGFSRQVCRAFGSLVYVLYSFLLLLFSRRITTGVEVYADGRQVGRFSSVALFVNNQPTIGKSVMPCPDARSDDGELSAMLMNKRSRLGTILTVVLMSLRGRHGKRSDAIRFGGEEITVRADQPATFIGDGEVLAHTRNLRLAVVPGALRVIA
ncbi:MAG: YegS/Rv2252/BmrU family lipid kinase [Candidatus Sericytochromatia bacterium]|nr:YegS/Rv2252/BmrU family lipid kinase [Candidatus Tanganyikabacteria bacterium]